jgi:hypothetical protein
MKLVFFIIKEIIGHDENNLIFRDKERGVASCKACFKEFFVMDIRTS